MKQIAPELFYAKLSLKTLKNAIAGEKNVEYCCFFACSEHVVALVVFSAGFFDQNLVAQVARELCEVFVSETGCKNEPRATKCPIYMSFLGAAGAKKDHHFGTLNGRLGSFFSVSSCRNGLEPMTPELFYAFAVETCGKKDTRATKCTKYCCFFDAR